MDNNNNYTTENNKYKKNFPMMTLEFKKNKTYKYNIMKLYIFIENFKKGYFVVKSFGPNKYGTAFLFKSIETLEELTLCIENIYDFAKKINNKHSEIKIKV